MYCTITQNAPDVILQAPFDATVEPRDFMETEIQADVHLMYSDTAVDTVSVQDINGIPIGATPRPRPA